MTIPSNVEILKALKEIEKKQKKKSVSIVRVPPKNAPIEERFKFSISQKLLEFKIAKGYSIDDMSKLFGTDRSNINKILNGRVEKVSLDRLFAYLRIAVLASDNKRMLSEFNKNIEHFIVFDHLKFA